jgi:signal transduction histidine kinase
VEAHGGKIAATSMPGQGATIRFRIPGLAGTPR